MTAPHFNILTQQELVIDLSRPAMKFLAAYIENGMDVTRHVPTPDVLCEIDNFRNLLHNILERTEPQNLDLIGG